MSDQEYKIDNLPIKDYSSDGRKVTQIPGEKVAFRPFDVEDKIDMTGFKIMQLDPKANAQFANPTLESTKDIKLRKKAEFGSQALRFAVVGSDNAPVYQQGEVLGWVMFTPDLSFRKKMVDKLSFGILKDAKLTLELSYQGFTQNQEGEGYISSAVRQTCLRLLQMQGLARDSIRPEVKKLRKIDLAITAYTDPKNLASRRVLERTGFKKIGEIPRYERNGKPEVNEVWVLDWDKLHQMEQDKMDKLLPELFTARNNYSPGR